MRSVIEKCGSFAQRLTLAIIALVLMQSGAFAQFDAQDLVDAVDLQGQVEGAALILGAALGLLIAVVLAFRIVKRLWGWVRKAV